MCSEIGHKILEGCYIIKSILYISFRVICWPINQEKSLARDKMTEGFNNYIRLVKIF